MICDIYFKFYQSGIPPQKDIKKRDVWGSLIEALGVAWEPGLHRQRRLKLQDLEVGRTELRGRIHVGLP